MLVNVPVAPAVILHTGDAKGVILLLRKGAPNLAGQKEEEQEHAQLSNPVRYHTSSVPFQDVLCSEANPHCLKRFVAGARQT